ncbi:MAG TPA: hypothetical protein VMY40_08525 [Anaerolineae bacterium]|nr:hypothetical protein [Anaerolineae bacterium]
MATYTKAELKSKFNFDWYAFPNRSEVEIRVPEWTSRYTTRLRLSESQGRVSVALPGLGGTFNLSYSYCGQLLLHGDGPVAIREWIDGSRGQARRFRQHPTYEAMVVDAVWIGLKMLRAHVETLRASWGRQEA